MNKTLMYKWLFIIISFVIVVASTTGIVLIWTQKWELTNSSGNLLNETKSKEMKIIYTILLGITILFTILFFVIIYHYYGKKLFFESSSLQGNIGNITSAFKNF